MMTTEYSTLDLGQALAYVRTVLDINSEETEGLTQQQKSYITFVNDRYIELSSKPQDNIFATIPRCACNSDRPFLSENMDFFISFLLIGIDEADEKGRSKLTKHLNDCFWCFELFTDVLRDYFFESEKINN